MKKVKSKGLNVTHIKTLKNKVKLNMKKEVAWAILLTTGFWLAFFLGFNS